MSGEQERQDFLRVLSSILSQTTFLKQINSLPHFSEICDMPHEAKLSKKGGVSRRDAEKEA